MPLSRTLLSAMSVVVLGAGGVATAGAGIASATPGSGPVSHRAVVAPLAVNNLGLSTAEAQNAQRSLRDAWGYTGAIDGQLGTESWKAIQRSLKANWGYTGAIDGVVGVGTISALQRALKSYGYYTGAIDGIAGPATQSAFRMYVNANDW